MIFAPSSVSKPLSLSTLVLSAEPSWHSDEDMLSVRGGDGLPG